MAKKRTLEDGPDPDLTQAEARLENIRPSFVSIVDVPANLRPFLVLKADQEGDLILPTDIKDALVGMLGEATTKLGDLLVRVRDADETTEALAKPIPDDMVAAIAEVIALLEGTARPPAPPQAGAPAAPTQMAASLKSALVAALEKTLAGVKIAGESVNKADGRLPTEVSAAIRIATELLRSQIADGTPAPEPKPASTTPATPAPGDSRDDVAKAGAVLSRLNRQRLEQALTLLGEALAQARSVPEPQPTATPAAPTGEATAKTGTGSDAAALARENTTLKKALAERNEELAKLKKARGPSNVEPLDGTPRPPSAHAWSNDINARLDGRRHTRERHHGR
jgi:hypothetical protein